MRQCKYIMKPRQYDTNCYLTLVKLMYLSNNVGNTTENLTNKKIKIWMILLDEV